MAAAVATHPPSVDVTVEARANFDRSIQASAEKLDRALKFQLQELGICRNSEQIARMLRGIQEFGTC
jgi:hypothetical protein